MRACLRTVPGLEQHKMFRRCASHRRQGHAAIERDEAPTPSHRERKQIGIGDLARTEYGIPVHCARFEQGQIIGPERMLRMGGGPGELRSDLPGGKRLWIGGVRHHANAARLGEWAGGPAVRAVRLQPGGGGCVMDMAGIEERDQHVHVKQRARRPAGA